MILKSVYGKLFEALNEIVNDKGNLEDKRKELLDLATEEDKYVLIEFLKWFEAVEIDY